MSSGRGLRWLRQGAALSAGIVLLAGCGREQPLDLDLDMRGLAQGFSTAPAADGVPSRPRPDDRGVISYPNYQVVVARRGDTVASIAQRLGVDAAAMASHNGLTPDTMLRRDEIVALPSPLAGSAAAPTTVAAASAPIAAPGSVAVTDLAAAAIDRAEATPAAAPAPPPSAGPEPIRHQVRSGETAFQLARRYGVSVATIAEWNGLSSDMAIREGQQLLIPAGGTPAPSLPVETAAVEPGVGSTTPVPPSAAEPLPEETVPIAAASEPQPAPPVASPDLGSQQAAPDARFVRPVEGAIIRAYAPGRNEGIDIGAAAGSPVRAADAGTVAAITTNTDGVQIVVIRHEGDLLTVYTHVDGLAVQRGSQVSRGQRIGDVRAGEPAFLHFEVREGMESRDPTNFLP